MTAPSRKTAASPIAFVTVFVGIFILAAACTSTETVPIDEVRSQEINKTVMCPVCPGESIDQSQHPLAIQMRGIVEEKLEDGWTGGQIREFFVERYGPSVLMEPPREGFNWLVWIVPPVGVAAGAVALYFVLRMAVQSATRRRETLADEIELTEDERDDYFRRIEAALAFDAGQGIQSDADTDTQQDRGEALDR